MKSSAAAVFRPLCSAFRSASTHGWRPAIALVYLSLFHSLLRLISFLKTKQKSIKCFYTDEELADDSSIRLHLAIFPFKLETKAEHRWTNMFILMFDLFVLPDVQVFHPNAPSAITTSLASQHSKHKRSKRRQYEQRVREVEGANFVPLVFLTAGGMGPACTTTFKRLASMLSGKFDCEYAAMLNWLRCRTSFALLRSTIMALRGSRRRLPTPPVQPALALAKSRLSHAN